MNALTLIQRDHDEVAELFDLLMVLARDSGNPQEAARVAARLVGHVRIHAASEERVFYQALLTATPELKWFALGGPHEHENLDTTLDKLVGRRPGDDEYRVIVKVARDLFEMHARDEEEGEILPLASKAFDVAELDRLGSAMLADQARIRPNILRLVGMPARAA